MKGRGELRISKQTAGTRQRVECVQLAAAFICLVVFYWGRRGLCSKETFAIKLNRPEPPVGQEFKISAELHNARDASFDPESKLQGGNSASGIELVGRLKMLAKEQGSEKVQVKIERLIEHNGTNSEVLLPTGTVVIGKRLAGESSFTAVSGRLPLRASQALGQLVHFGSEDLTCTGDQALGTKDPKKVGDTWRADTACVTNAMRKLLEVFDPNHLDATMKLSGIEEIGGIKCLRLTLSAALRSDRPPRGAGFANDPKLRALAWDTTIHFTIISLLPLNQELPSMRQEEATECLGRATLTSGQQTASWEFSRNAKTTREMISPGQ
jgi:hypothetical protein